MTITLTWQSIITAGAVITALTVIITLLAKVVRFIDRQKKQDEEIKHTRQEREDEMKKIRETHNADVKLIKEEQTVIVYGLLACLKGLKEQGCNGPVTAAIDTLEKHLNIEAHK